MPYVRRSLAHYQVISKEGVRPLISAGLATGDVEPGLPVDGVRPIGQTMKRWGTWPRRAAFSDWPDGQAYVPSARTIAVFELRAAMFLTQTALLALIY